ncbi:MAG TPA: putative quinol monooxygenase [Methylomirabilota bacterium]|nr:putative quinol monooxygenase [Methylomirabilota bacterium]
MAGVLTVVAKIHPRAGKEDEVQAILIRMAEAVRKAEPECLIYRPHRLETSPPVFLFYEQYRSDAAFEFHKTAPHLADFRAQMKGLLARPTEIELYRSLTD